MDARQSRGWSAVGTGWPSTGKALWSCRWDFAPHRQGFVSPPTRGQPPPGPRSAPSATRRLQCLSTHTRLSAAPPAASVLAPASQSHGASGLRAALCAPIGEVATAPPRACDSTCPLHRPCLRDCMAMRAGTLAGACIRSASRAAASPARASVPGEGLATCLVKRRRTNRRAPCSAVRPTGRSAAP